MVRKLFDRKVNNRGSALLTVILVVGFLTILATTLLYVSGMNFQIKQADYQNKKNFYTGETALEVIRAELMEKASVAAAEAYNDVNTRYVTLASKEARRLEYNKVFVEKIQEQFIPPDTGVDDWGLIVADWSGTLQARFTPDPWVSLPYNLSLDKAYDPDEDGVFLSADVVDVNEVDGYIRIKGIRLVFTDPETKLTTIISTDLDVRAPEIDWGAESSVQTLEDEVTPEMAASSRTTVDASKCVKYANWKKE